MCTRTGVFHAHALHPRTRVRTRARARTWEEMRVTAALFVLALALYAAWIRGQSAYCATQYARDYARFVALSEDLQREFNACAFDTVTDAAACSIAPEERVGPVRAAVLPETGPHTLTQHEASLWCTIVMALPDPLGAIGVSAADAPQQQQPVVEVVVSRSRLHEHEAALEAFRAQCVCPGAWWAPWWRTRANYDHKVSYEFVRTGLRADVLRAELRRAAPFYARFGGAIDTWVESVARPGGGDQMMSDHGMLWRDERRHVAMIVRYILVVYRAPLAPASAEPVRYTVWGTRASTAPTPADGDASAVGGTFTLCMSEVQVTTWPAGDCDCAHDHALHQRLRETVDARMKKFFADSASHTIRAIPDAFDEEPNRAPRALPLPAPPALPVAAAQTPPPPPSEDTL